MFEAGQGVLHARVKEVNLQMKIFHCLLRREELASRRLSEELDVVMKGHSVSCYERGVTKKKIFSQKCPDIGSYYMHLFCCSSPQTGHITLSSTPYRQLENQSTKYHRQQLPV